MNIFFEGKGNLFWNNPKYFKINSLFNKHVLKPPLSYDMKKSYSNITNCENL